MKEIFWSEHTSSQMWCYLKFPFWDEEMKSEMKSFFFDKGMKRQMKSEMKSEVEFNWRDDKWDKGMKSEMKRWKKISVQTYVKPNLVLSQIPFTVGVGVVRVWCRRGGGGGPKTKLPTMVWNMLLFWNFWDPMKFAKFRVWANKQATIQTDIHPYRHHSDYDKSLHS